MKSYTLKVNSPFRDKLNKKSRVTGEIYNETDEVRAKNLIELGYVSNTESKDIVESFREITELMKEESQTLNEDSDKSESFHFKKKRDKKLKDSETQSNTSPQQPE